MIKEELPDKRSLGMKDTPYSAYCKVCWLPVYDFTLDVHDQMCSEPKLENGICSNAKSLIDNAVAIKKTIEMGY